jgi:hypothetical protein
LPLALTDSQMRMVLAAAAQLDDPAKRHTLLQRLAGHLQRAGGQLTDGDLDRALAASLRGLLHRQSA